jgi:multicomponent Na+:H+ antiporter subunit B
VEKAEMTVWTLNILLIIIVVTGFLSLLSVDLYISVFLLATFSLLSALLFYIAHAPDVAITEAAIGAGMTTLLFVWAIRTCTHTDDTPGLESRFRRHAFSGFFAVVDVLLVIGIGVILYLFLPALGSGADFMRDYLLLNGPEEIGTRNLVSAVYLGYRAFDTFGETIVLLCAVTASVYFLSKQT